MLMTPSPFHLILGVFSLDQIAAVAVNLSRYVKLFGREIIFEVPGIPTYMNVTDRQTDRQTDDVLWHHRAVRCIAR